MRRIYKHLSHTANCKLQTARLLTAICLLLFCQLTHAQLYPVQTVHNLIPPYNTKLNDYATSSDVKLRLRLILNDNTVNNRQVRLKLKIQGNGLNIQSANFVTGAPFIFLNGGTQQQFTNIDLAPYFQLNNLVGINPQQYNLPLPDGSYKICWEVYDFQTNQLISNPNMGCDNVFLLLNDPPFLNLPQRGDQLTSATPFINFQWTPRHANATNVSYEFQLREIWDNNIDPQAGFLASPNYYTQTTFSTTLLYGIGLPELFPGRTYAWRVRAISSTGLSENSVFRNDGYSEIYYFTYANECFPPTMTLAEPLNTGRVKISWQTHPDHNRYHVQYKRADVADAEWFEIFSYNNQTQVGNLQAGVTYDFRVGGTCHSLTDLNQGYSYSTPNQFTMPTADETVSYSCGIVPEIEISNTTPLGNLGVNETFTAGDFPVTVKQIQGGNGTYSGTGYIVVPYLADTKIAVEFTGIKINTEYQLYDGIIKTTYDPTWSGVEDVGDLFNGSDGQVNINEVDFPIGEILIDPNGDILIVGQGGQPVVELPGGEDYVITDSNGQVWAVDEEGNVTPLGPQAEGGSSTAENTDGVNSNGEATSISAQGVEVTFTKAPNNVYGFDGYESNQSQTKDLYKKLGNNYYMPYKAVAKGKDDYIVANLNISDTNIQPQDLIFKTKDGVALTKIDSTATSYTFKLTGTLSDADVETHAVIKQGEKYQIAGAFMQYQSASKDVDVILVNTANTNTQNIKDKLKEIYQQSMVNLTITEINNFDINSYVSGNTIESGESGFLANYTNQQQSINSAIKSRSDYNQSAYYLILTDVNPVNADGNANSEKGLMPIGRQFGYVYTANCATANCLPLTASHELGHGAFQLKHPFSTHSYGWNENATNWLLDYNNGEHLPYAHWKNIHNPDIHIGIFDGDGEGESVTTGMHSSLAINKKRYNCESGNCVEDDNGKYYFAYLTPSGKRIILPQEYMPTFYHGIENDKYTNIIPGTLIGFKRKQQPEDIKYWSTLSTNGITFSGYDNNFEYSDINIPNDDNSIVIGLPYAGASNSSWKNYKFILNSLEVFQTGDSSVMDITSDDFKNLNLFGTNNQPTETRTITNINSLIGDEQHSISESELKILRGRYFEIPNITDFTTLIQGIATVPHNEKAEVFLVIKIAEIQNRYPIIFKNYSKWFDMWNVYALTENNYLSVKANIITNIVGFNKGEWEEDNIIDSNITNSSSDYRKWKDNIVSPPGNRSLLYDFYRKFINDLRIYSNQESTNNIACLENLKDKEYNQIIECVEIASNDEIATHVSFENRTKAIKTLISKYGDTDVLRNREETVVTRLVKYTPSSFDEDSFLTFLTNSDNVITVTDMYGHGGDSHIVEMDYALWHLMFEKIDDSHIFYPGDNRELLIKALSKHYYKSNKFQTDLQETTEYLKKKQLQDLIELNPKLEDASYQYTYDYQNIVRRGWSFVKATAASGPIGFIYEYDPNSDKFFSIDTQITDLNEITVTHKIKWSFFDVNNEYSTSYDPFGFTMFANLSKENLLKDFSLKDNSGKTQALPVPAIVLHYASETGNAQTKADIIQTTIDVATLAIPGGQINTLGRVFYYADKISSVASIAGTGLRDENEEIAGYLNMVSLATGVVSIGDLVISTKKLNQVLDPNVITTFNPVKNTEDLADYINDAGNLDILQKVKPLELKYSEEILSRDLVDFQAANIIDAARITKLENALATIRNLGSKLKKNHIENDVLNLINRGLDPSNVASWINSNDEFLDVLIHSTPNANGKFEIIVEKVTHEINAEELAALILADGSNKTVRLLSCNNTESAVELSRILGRDVVGSVGEMRLYDNGLIETGQWYRAKPDGSLDEYADIATSGLTPTNNSVLLKAGFVDNLDNLILDELVQVFGVTVKDELLDIFNISTIPSTWKLEKINNTIKLVDSQGLVWAQFIKRSDGKMIIKAPSGSTGAWNQFLNADPPLMTNTIYEVDGGRFVYETDNLGRVKKAIYDDVQIRDKARQEAYQMRTKEVKDGSTVNVDDGGHIFRNEWGGPSEQINYFSQNNIENRSGSWFQMEKAISDMLKSDTPPSSIKVEMEFNFSGNSKRPESVDVDVFITRNGQTNLDTNLTDTYLNPL